VPYQSEKTQITEIFFYIILICFFTFSCAGHSEYPYRLNENNERAVGTKLDQTQQEYQQNIPQIQRPTPQQPIVPQNQPTTMGNPYQQNYRQQQYPNYYYPSPYQQGGSPGSRFYSDPYAIPPANQYYQRYDMDQYYVPPNYYNNVEAINQNQKQKVGTNQQQDQQSNGGYDY
jgi:hypothetical protein